jgi:SOS-response transcriptional repressor LexA
MKNKSQKEVADAIGVTFQVLSHYENGRREPDLATLNNLAEYYGVSADYLIKKEFGTNYDQEDYDLAYKLGDNSSPRPPYNREETRKWFAEHKEIQKKSDIELAKILQKHQFDRDVTKINIYGKIPAGIPVELCEDIIGEEEIPTKWTRGGKSFFGLSVTGNSMLPEFKDKDILIFRNYLECESGQFCAVTVNGNEATFKKVIKRENGITLQPLNPEFEPLFFTKEQIENQPVQIIGVLWEVRRSYK